MSTRKTGADIKREDVAWGLNLPGNVVKVEPGRGCYRVTIDRLNERSMRRLVKILRVLLDGESR